jgi:hypothetical protein
MWYVLESGKTREKQVKFNARTKTKEKTRAIHRERDG